MYSLEHGAKVGIILSSDMLRRNIICIFQRFIDINQSGTVQTRAAFLLGSYIGFTSLQFYEK